MLGRFFGLRKSYPRSLIRPKLNEVIRLSLLFADYADIYAPFGGGGVMSPVMTQVRIHQRGKNNLNIYGAYAARMQPTSKKI